jgi:putative (di)nucleoside polyphosphate hydrolase
MAKPSTDSLKLRPNVAGILRDRAGKILIAERIDVRGAWQFPQGGVDPGETLEQALAREMREELSLRENEYRILDCKGPYQYLYGGAVKKGFHGKLQHFFLAEFLVDDPWIDVDTEHPEFRAIRWIFPKDFRIKWLPEMKREVYRAVFSQFFNVQIR